VNSKKIALIVVFTALTALLNLSPIKIPAPYAPFLIYQVWEVPIVTVSILYGFSLGLIVSIVNTFVLLLVFPGALPTGPLYNLAAVVSMLLGIYVAKSLVTGFINLRNETVSIITLTMLGTVLRVAAMTIINWFFLPYPPPVGFSMPAEIVVTMLPVIGFFNATLALYTIPLGVILARAVKDRSSAVNAHLS
jgi:riboflavin transporter FmnP